VIGRSQSKEDIRREGGWWLAGSDANGDPREADQPFRQFRTSSGGTAVAPNFIRAPNVVIYFSRSELAILRPVLPRLLVVALPLADLLTSLALS